MAYRLTQKQYADRRGISQQAVAKLIRQGKLDGAFRKDGRRYLIDADRADAVLDLNRNPARSKTPKTAAPPPAIVQGVPLADGIDRGSASTIAGELVSFAEAARREKVARAALLELDLKKKRGDLVEKEKVEAVAAKLGTLVRVGIEAIPARVAPSVVALETPGDVSRFLQQEVKSVLADLAKGIADLDL
jgi:hypothetical protein